VLAISSKIRHDFSSMEKLIFLGVISFPLAIFLLLAFEAFIAVGVLLGVLFLILIIQNYRYGLYFVVIGLPLFQSLSLKSDAANSMGINLQYILIPIVFFSWLAERISKKEFTRLKFPLLSLLLFFVLVLIATVVNQMDVVSNQLIRRGSIQIYSLINYIILFYILVNEKLDKEDIQKIFWGLLCVGFIAASIGIFQYFTTYTGPTGGLRATSTFKSFLRTNTRANPNAFGTYLAFISVLVLFFWNTSRRKNRPMLIFIFGILVFCLILSLSRSSLLALIFSILCYTFYRNKKAFLIVILISIIGFVGLYFEPIFHRRIESIVAVVSDKRVIQLFLNVNPRSLDWAYVERFGIQGYHSDIISGAFRFWAWIQGFHLFIAHPFLGVGYNMTLGYSPWPTAENFYLDILSMTGLAGFSLFIIIQVIFLKHGFRLLKSPHLSHIGMLWINILAIVFFTSITGSVLFESKLSGIFWSLAGIFYNVKIKENNYYSK
jgi:O-antigen ligase